MLGNDTGGDDLPIEGADCSLEPGRGKGGTGPVVNGTLRENEKEGGRGENRTTKMDRASKRTVIWVTRSRIWETKGG